MKLKLWQQIFLVSLAFTLLSSGGISLLTQSGTFSAAVEREQENALALHANLSGSLKTGLQWQRYASGSSSLGKQQVEALLTRQLSEQQTVAGFCAVSLRQPDGTPVGEQLSEADVPAELFERVRESNKCVSLIRKQGDAVVLQIASPLETEKLSYILLTATDVSSLYAAYRQQSEAAGKLSLLLAALCSLILLVICYRLFRPLRNVNRALKQVADGEYSRRLPEAGSEEFRVLSRNVNSMAQAIGEQTDRLQAVADSRKRFVDSMAHEMKTPLTSILCMADLLRIKKDVPDKERREYASVIVEEANRMKALSSKLLTLASADSSSTELKPVSLEELLSEVKNAMQPILEKQQIRLTVAGEDVTLLADRQLFQTLLINLIDNAAKASSPGMQVLVCHTVQDGKLLLAVVDEGIGMTKEELSHATEAFWMADKSRSRKAGGAGLGLSLCDEIAKLHGATMTLTGEPGKGTTVCLTIPLPIQTERREEP